jgi:hypothetical protein
MLVFTVAKAAGLEFEVVQILPPIILAIGYDLLILNTREGK